MSVFDNRRCILGEGVFWHPLRQQLFWFDILSKKLLSRQEDKTFEWEFDETVSSAAWVDQSKLLVAGETGLSLFDVDSGTLEKVVELEANNSVTRSNDGRADPYGGFWIGTMGKGAEEKAGAIYRYYKGEVRTLFSGLTITNSICFSVDGNFAYFSDTVTHNVMRVRLTDKGWPVDEPAVYLDLTSERLLPDGAVVDADDNIWVAQWGASRVAAYNSNGLLTHIETFPASQISCPCFGGKDCQTLFVTSATLDLDHETLSNEFYAGSVFDKVFDTEVGIGGLAEYQVVL